MKKHISTDLTTANIARVMEMLADTPEALARLGAGLTDEQLRKPLSPGERSFIEVTAHILNCESRTFEAITLALLEKEPLVPSVHPERQVGSLLRFDLLAFPELLAYFKLRRRVLLRVLSGLSEAQWSRTIRQEGKQRRESVYWQARGQALHEHEHLLELESKLGEG